MSYTIYYAKTELEAIGVFDKEKDFYGGMTGKSVMELVEVFSKQGHSGMSAPIVVDLFSKVALHKPLSPITGEESEWVDEQNKRCSALFRSTIGAYYLNAIVWKGEEAEDTFTGTVQGVRSRQYVKFPFTPKTFYIDVRRELYDKEKHGPQDDDGVNGVRVVSCGNGDYVYFIKDRKQLEDVFGYYIKTIDIL